MSTSTGLVVFSGCSKLEGCPSLSELTDLIKPERRVTVEQLQERFYANVKKTEGGCWLWMGRRNHKGYGVFHFLNGTTVLAHRLSWFMKYGAELLRRGNNAEGMCMLHICDNPPCVNPDHLFLGTKADNNEDMVRKGRNSHLGGKGLNKGARNGQVKLDEEKVVEIRKLLRQGVTQAELGRMFGVHRGTIGEIHRGRNWRHV